MAAQHAVEKYICMNQSTKNPGQVQAHTLAIALIAAAASRAASMRSFATVGEMIPDLALDKGFPPEKISLREYTKGKSVVFVGLPYVSDQ